MAERLARILASSRYAVQLLTRAPQTVQMLADDEQLRPRSLAELQTEMRAAARRQGSRSAAVEAIRAIRRRELFRMAAGDLLGRASTCCVVGAALTDLASATIDAALSVVAGGLGRGAVPGDRGDRDGPVGRPGDVVRLRRGRDVRDGRRQRARHRPDQTAGAVITEMRKLLARPGADPALSVDADLRPEGKGGALIRSLTAYRNYYSRWSSTWELQALVRADALAGDAAAGSRPDGRDRRPALAGGRADRGSADRDPQAQGPGGGRAAAARRRPGQAHQARPRRAGRRGVDRPAAPAAARRTSSRRCARRRPSSPCARPRRPG